MAGWPGHALHAFQGLWEETLDCALRDGPFVTNVMTMPPGGAAGGPTGSLRLGRGGLCILKLSNSPLLPHHPPVSGTGSANVDVAQVIGLCRAVAQAHSGLAALSPLVAPTGRAQRTLNYP